MPEVRRLTQGRGPILLVLAVCVSLRLLLMALVHPWDPIVAREVVLQSDAAGYHELAVSLLEHHEFSVDGEPNALRTPGYPLMLGLVYAVFGVRPHLALLVQAVLDGLSCLILHSMVAGALGKRIALFASLLYAIDPFLVLFSNTLLSDTLFILLLVASSCSLAPALTDGAPLPRRRIAASAIVLGLAALTRPIAVFLPVPVILSLLVVPERPVVERVRAAAGFSLLFTLTLCPWLIRNRLVFGSLAISTSSAHNLVALFTVPVEMERRGIPDRRVVRRQLFDEAEELIVRSGAHREELNEFERARYWRRLALRYFASDPSGFARHYGLGVIRLFASLGTGSYAQLLRLENPEFEPGAHSNLVALARAWLDARTPAQLLIGIVTSLYLLTVYTTASLGLWASRRSMTPFLLYCLAVAIYFVVVTGTAGRPRLRLPVITFCLPFAAIGIEAVRSRLSMRPQPRRDRNFLSHS